MYVQIVICCELVPLFIVGRTKCLSLVCHERPSCSRWVPCSQDGGPPLWPWWCRTHSLAPCSLFWSVVHGGVPCEILWIWCEGHWQGWPFVIWQVIAYHFLMCETIIQYNILCCEYFIVCFFTSCMCRYIVHACVPVVFVCMESSSTVEPL